MNDLPDWITVGAKVGVCKGTYNISISTVSRLTPTLIILDSGERFRRRDLFAVGSYAAQLLPMNDPDVVRILMQRRINHLRHRLDELLRGAVPNRAEAMALLTRANEMIEAVRIMLSGQ